MSAPRVVVSGLGIASAVGWTEEETWQAICAGRSGLGRLTLFPSERCGDLPVGQLPADPAERSGLKRGSRSDHLAVWCAAQAWKNAALERDVIRPERGAVVLGALTGGMTFLETSLGRLVREGVADATNLDLMACNHAADRVAERFNLGGFRSTASNACASGSVAISTGYDLLVSGEADVVLAGGVDTLNSVLVNGFNALMLISPQGCRPFDAHRTGLSVGEGSAVLVLETEEHALARGATVRAVLAGRGNTCDAHHATAPQGEGLGIRRAMARALDEAGLESTDIGYINAHGTGTPDNDKAEGQAIRALFGPDYPAVSSTKPFFGHTMGAAGAIEAAVAIMALEKGAVPPNLGFEDPDPAVGIEPVATLQRRPIRAALSNSLGFGGNNAALLFVRPEHPTKITQHSDNKSFSVDVLASEALRPAADPVQHPAPEAMGAQPWMAHRLTAPPGKGQFPPGCLRRLGRAQAMALSVGHRAVQGCVVPLPADDRVAVVVGTAWAEFGVEASFLETMIRRGEIGARPAKFAKSVHNAVASQLAIQFGWTGENHTFTHGRSSFEGALWQARQLLRSRRAERVVLAGVDAFDDFLELRGHLLDELRPEPRPLRPLAEPTPIQGTVPGEGAAAFVLAPGRSHDSALARISAVTCRTAKRDGRATVAQALSAAGLEPADIDLLLLGANGDRSTDQRHQRALSALQSTPGWAAGAGVYRHNTGDFATATALGLVEAVQACRTGQLPATIRSLDHRPTRPLRHLLLLHLGADRHSSALVVSSARG